MKSLLAIVILFTAVCVTHPTASAQEQRVQATVPFNFVVGSSHLAAGTYILSAESSSHILNVRNKENGVGALALSMPIGHSDRETSVLIFNKYGDQYFLSEVRCDTCTMNVHMPSTKAEKRARSQVQEAGIFRSDPVLIALK